MRALRSSRSILVCLLRCEGAKVHKFVCRACSVCYAAYARLTVCRYDSYVCVHTMYNLHLLNLADVNMLYKYNVSANMVLRGARSVFTYLIHI